MTDDIRYHRPAYMVPATTVTLVSHRERMTRYLTESGDLHSMPSDQFARAFGPLIGGGPRTRASVIHVAVCQGCEQTADLDGGEYALTPAEAVKVVLDDAGWEITGDQLLCDECIMAAGEVQSDD